ncbi:MAG: hypothetical protein PHC50_02640 [Candidatus Cloacimonetes bacterium]|nr:hypothetical protein [Candidatus Cloacimonadota bacterium]
MFKRLFLLFLLVLPLWLLAQEMPFRVKSSSRYSVSTLAGKVVVDSTSYYQLRLIQEIAYKKFGMGVDLDFLFDKNFHIKKSDWDNIGDILGKIYYIRYGEPKDEYYGHFGGFPKRSVGNGLVMHNYSNMHFYPDQRNNGILLGYNPEIPMEPKFEIFSSDIERAPVISLSGRFQPLPETSWKYTKDLELGLALFSDLNQKANSKYIARKSQIDKPAKGSADALGVVSVDYSLPVFNTDKMVFGNYAEMAHIFDHGTGFILPGIYADFNFLKVNLEYRMHGDSFIPGYFDNFYENERFNFAEIVDESDPELIDYQWQSKEQSLKESPAAYGFYGKVEGKAADRVKGMFAWQNMYGDGANKGKSLWFSLWVDTRYKRLENVAFNYSKTRVNELSLGKVAVPRAQMSGSFTLLASEKYKTYIIGKYSEKYKDKEGGINWLKDTKRSVSVGVKVAF